MRRPRSPAERHGPVTRSVRKYAQDRNITLAKVTQSDVELWHAAGPHRPGATTRLPPPADAQPQRRPRGSLAWPRGLYAQIIADDQRWTLLRRCLPDETMDLRFRAAGTLALRYGQPTTHTVELTRDHLITGEAGGLPASENPAELWQV